MGILQKTLERVSLGEPQHADRLTLIPLISPAPISADYNLLAAAQAEGLATVVEISKDGRVNELLLENGASLPLFLLDGEELLGAKQNRIVNLSLLIPAFSKRIIPVSCVEEGRWRYESDEFFSSDRAFFASGRARKCADVSDSLSNSGSRSADQGAVWADVTSALFDHSVTSRTCAVSAVYEQKKESLDQIDGQFHAGDGHVGGVFLLDGVIRGVELFDATATWKTLMPKVLRCYSIETLRGQSQSESASNILQAESYRELSEKFLSRLGKSRVKKFSSLGDGADIRIMENGLSGGALWLKGRIVHLCAFTTDTVLSKSRNARGRRDSHGDNFGDFEVPEFLQLEAQAFEVDLPGTDDE